MECVWMYLLSCLLSLCFKTRLDTKVFFSISYIFFGFLFSFLFSGFSVVCWTLSFCISKHDCTLSVSFVTIFQFFLFFSFSFVLIFPFVVPFSFVAVLWVFLFFFLSFFVLFSFLKFFRKWNVFFSLFLQSPFFSVSFLSKSF